MKSPFIPSHSSQRSAPLASHLGAAVILLCLASADFSTAGTTTGKPQQLTSPDQTPEGLEKSDWASIHAAHEGWKHQFNPVEGGWQARNPGQQWNTRFDGRGFMTTPDGASWTWGMEFQSYGFGENLTEISGTPEVRASGQRLSYHWNANVEEWFINDQRGLEHGFIVKERPQGAAAAGAPLAFIMTATGSLKPSVSSDAQTVHFRDAAGAPVLNYSGLKVWDAEGTILPSRFERGADNTFRLLVEESAARYPITIDPIAQQAYLKASNTGADDLFGYRVAVSGDTVIVGATKEDSNATGINGVQTNNSATDSGAAYIFTGFGPSTTAPSITTQPASPTILSGNNATLSVGTTGTTPLTYQWYQGAVGTTTTPVGTNSASFTTPTLTTATTYWVRISNAAGSVNSIAATVTVTIPVTIVDPALEAALRTTLSKSTGPITEADMLTLTNLNLSGLGLTSLSGLEYASNLNLVGPDASTLPPGTGTSGLPSITTPEDLPAGTLLFEFLRRKGSGLVYAPRKSTTLDGANWAPLAAAPVVTSINDQWERVVYTEAPDPVLAPACFGRVEVKIP